MTTLPPTLNDVPNGLPDECFVGPWRPYPRYEPPSGWVRLIFVLGGPTGNPQLFLAVSKTGLPEHVEQDVADAVKEAERQGYRVATRREWREAHPLNAARAAPLVGEP